MIGRHRSSSPSRDRGFTLVELLAAVAVVGILTGIVLTQASRISRTTKIQTAITDILNLQMRIDEFAMTRDSLPGGLAAIGAGADPWGRAYRYLALKTPRDVGLARVNKFLVPVNTLYDLYSVGPDGATRKGLNSPDGRDDIVRAGDGAYIGVAGQY